MDRELRVVSAGGPRGLISFIRASLLAVVIASAAIGTATAGADGERAPVTVVLSAAKTSLAFGQPLVLEVSFRNESSEVQRVPLSGPGGSRGYPLGVSVDGAGQSSFAGLRLLAGDVLVLSPGASTTFRRVLPILPVGQHELQVKCHLEETMVTLDPDGGSRPVSGDLTSNTISVAVVDRPLSPAEERDFGRKMDWLAERARLSGYEGSAAIACHIAEFMPLSKEWLVGMLGDQDAGVRMAAAVAIGELAGPSEGGDFRLVTDTSLLPDLLEQASREDRSRVRCTIAAAISSAAGTLTADQKEQAVGMLREWILQTQWEAEAGAAADALMELAPAQAAHAVRERMLKRYGQEDEFTDLLESALERHTGIREVKEGLKRLEQQGE
ncbi:MAG: hypothetical protein JW990_12670 [Thermoleophilia bacterium]|nr:hypothetical protein [Thermoleophilia bacterium]